MEDSDAYSAPVREVNVTEHQSNHESIPGQGKSDRLVELPVAEKIKKEIKSDFYELRKGKVWFSKAVKREHRKLKTSLFKYVLQSRFFAVVTAPCNYVCIIPFAMLDLFVSTY